MGIAALNTAIASASGADKIAKEAQKATKEQKKKLKEREIEYTYTKSKQDAGRKNALAGVKAKMEEFFKETSKKEASDQLDAAYEMAQSATTDADIRTAFPGAGAKIDAYKIALDTANTKLDTEIAGMDAGTAKDAKLAEKTANLAKKENVPAAELKKIKWKCVQDTAKAAAKDARMPKKGSIEDVRETNIAADIAAIAALDTEIEGLTGEDKIAKVAEKATKEAEKLTKETERDVSFKKMMNEIAQEKASGTMAAAMRAKPDMTDREKLDAVKIEMKKSLANDEAISDSKVRDFVKKGAIKKAREVAKTAKGATKKETRDSVQAAMKESLGKPDKLVGGVYVSQVTETDVELFLEEAAIDEVDSVMSSCVESGDKLANGYDATTALGACETKAKDAFKAFRGGEEAALGAEITALDTKIAGMAEGAAKEVEKATKATKEQKKKLKAREIEYTYTKSKQDAGRKNALAGVKAKMEDAKSKNI